MTAFERKAGELRHEVELGWPDIAMRAAEELRLVAVAEAEMVRDELLVERVDIGTDGFDVQLRLDGMATFAREMREAA